MSLGSSIQPSSRSVVLSGRVGPSRGATPSVYVALALPGLPPFVIDRLGADNGKHPVRGFPIRSRRTRRWRAVRAAPDPHRSVRKGKTTPTTNDAWAKHPGRVGL